MKTKSIIRGANKIRLDKFLYNTGRSESDEKAGKEIIAGWVKVNGETVHEPSRLITGNEEIEISRPGGKFASRGGEKLDHALKYFDISVKDLTAADLGSSTGGFTDCLLKNGAKKVYAVDVGYGLLAHNLRSDPRVIVKERTSVRKLSGSDFQDKIDFITVDLSFISILKVFDIIKKLFSPAKGIILLKPQFEAKHGEHEKGVVKEKQYHINILKRVIHSLLKSGMIFNGLHYSPIKGPAGNIEFLLYFKIDELESVSVDADPVVEEIVNEAHKKLIS